MIVFSILSIAKSDIKKTLIDKPVISIVDNLRIRETSDLNSKVTGYLNKGDIAIVKEISLIKTKVKNKEDYWYRIKTDTSDGWVFGALITDEFHMNNDKSVILWSEEISGTDEDDIKILVSIFNKKTNKTSQTSDIPWWFKEIKLSPDGKYFVVARNQDGDYSLDFYKTDSIKKLLVKTHYDKEILKWRIQWIGDNKLNFNEIIYSTTEKCYVCVTSFFEDGKLSSGKNDFLLCGDSDNCCDELYRVNVSLLKIYDKQGGNGKVVCTAKMNEYVNKHRFEKETLTSGDSEWIEIESHKCGDNNKFIMSGYVLKKDLKKVK